jgi:hypothetical protein
MKKDDPMEEAMTATALMLAEERGLVKPMVYHRVAINSGKAWLYAFQDKNGKRDWLVAV